MANNAIQTAAPAGATNTATTTTLPPAPAPVAERKPSPPGPWRKAFTALASLRLTVVLFALSILLIFFGTLAQIDMSTFSAVQRYFRCWYIWVPIQLFLPRALDIPTWLGFPFPGGYILGGLLLVNLLSAHSIRFRFRWMDLAVLPLFVVGYVLFWYWQNHPSDLLLTLSCVVMAVFVFSLYPLHGKRAGIILIHLGIIMLLVGELVTGLYAVEQRMTIGIGETANFTDHSFEGVQIVFETATSPTEDTVVAIPSGLLKNGRTISNPALPVDVQVVEYMPNSMLADADPKQKGGRPFVRTSMGEAVSVEPRKEGAGVSQEQREDAPSVIVALKKKGTNEEIGRYVLSLWFYSNFTNRLLPIPPQTIKVDGKTWAMELRYPHELKPYSVLLQKFEQENYPGTKKPKSFTSWVHLTDPTRDEDRQVRIWMNNPLRYHGETFFQSGVLGREGEPPLGTVLQVVRNPGWLLPYFSCAIVAIGMISHFGYGLVGFLKVGPIPWGPIGLLRTLGRILRIAS
jgi:hypothetical protein